MSKFAAIRDFKTEPVASEATLPSVSTERARTNKVVGKSRQQEEWHKSTVILRHTTKRAAVRKLEDAGDKRDLSELVEQLLQDWVKA